MRRLSVIGISLLLISGGQLAAQTTEPSVRVADPFGESPNTPNTVAPTRGEPDPNPAIKPADQSKKRTPPPREHLFPPVVVSGASAADQRIEEALNRETTFDYLEQPLKDVANDIAFSHEIPIIIDIRALEDFAIDPATPITKSLSGTSLRSALRLTLRELELTYVIRDEVLQITTLETASVTLSTRFYRVTELLPPNGDGQVLVELITTFVAPDTWCGPGAIIYVEHLESLAIQQTADAFHEIEELLATTKKLAEMQPVKDSVPYEVLGGAIAQ